MAERRATYRQLMDWAWGDLSGPDAERCEAAAGTDPAAARAVQLHRLVRETVREDDGVEPPRAVLEAARAIYRPPAAAPTLLERVADAVEEIVGRLVFDSRSQPALAAAGLRGEAAGHQLTWEVEGADLDVQLEPTTDGRWRLLGQLSTPGEIGGPLRVELCPPGASAPIESCECDGRGFFALTVEEGTYDLRLHRPGSIAIFPDLHV